MKNIFKKIVIGIITIEAKIVLIRFKPKIIAVTGSVGKTTTKDAIYTALSSSFHIRKNQKSLNSEIGTPLTILGLDTGWDKMLPWIKNMIDGFLVIFSFKYPDWLVLEVGVDRPGDIKRLGRWLKPDIVVLTTFPTLPAHVEYFNSPEAVIEEKKKLIKYLKNEGVLILNADDPKVLESRELSKSKIFTYGMNEGSDVFVSNSNFVYEMINDVKLPTGISFKANYAGNSVPVSQPGVLGIQHMYPVVAALAVGLSQGVSFIEMINSLSKHRPPQGRMNLIEGMNDSVIIDDSYNASPVSVSKALEVLRDIETKGSKIAVIGDMLEIGSFSANEHKKVGKMVKEVGVDYLFAVGVRAEFIATAAFKAGMDENKIFYFKDNAGVADELKNLIKKGSVVLVKGSQGIRTEKIVKEIMANPEKSKELLVRQDKAWDER